MCWSDDGELNDCAGQDRWCTRVGQPSSLGRGQFDQYWVMLRRDFGLDVWISHVQREEKPVDPNYNVAHSTIAYLRLNEVTGCAHYHEQEMSDLTFSMNREKREVGGAMSLKLPTTPSGKARARFNHAVKALDLEVQKTFESVNEAHEGLFGGGMWPHTEAKVVMKNGTKPSEQAKLTMLTTSEDDAEW